jgi:hypothetical protein
VLRAKIDIIKADTNFDRAETTKSDIDKAKPKKSTEYTLTCKWCKETKTLDTGRSGKRKRRAYCSDECSELATKEYRKQYLNSDGWKRRRKALYKQKKITKRRGTKPGPKKKEPKPPKTFKNEWDHNRHEAWEDPANGITKEKGYTEESAPRKQV